MHQTRTRKTRSDTVVAKQSNQQQVAPMGVSKTVTTCYEILDLALAGGIQDFTDGKYDKNPRLPYESAQDQQAQWLLDQIHCDTGTRMLDIGCGNGRILKSAEARGAVATGITISEKQIRRTTSQGLDARWMNYRDIPEDWNNQFDGIIANGSVEHFVQVADAIEGNQEAIYREMFEICWRLLKPGGYFATTIIHFRKPFDPLEINKGATAHPKGSDNDHMARLAIDDFGGWYPVSGQLQRCAERLFMLDHWEDGTEDYRLTSETWLKILRRKCAFNPAVWLAVLRSRLRNGKATTRMISSLLSRQSWMWQFRPQGNQAPPMQLRRDVWRRVD